MASEHCSGEINTSSRSINFDWKISVDHCFKSVESENLIYSPVFTVNSDNREVKWQLHLLLENKEDSAVRVCLTSLNEFDIKATSQLAIQKADKMTCKVLTQPFEHLYTIGNRCSAISPFINCNILNCDEYLQNNHISFHCCISVKELSDLSKCQKSFNRLEEFDDFERLMLSGELSDFIITADKEDFYVHKCILMARSDVFKAMFENSILGNNQTRVEVNDIRPDVLTEFLRFIYTGKVYLIEEMVCELLYTAAKYSVGGLKIMCEETMCLNLSLNNALKYLELALIHNATKLKEGTIKFIAQHAEDVCNKPELKLLGVLYPELSYEIMNAVVYKKNF